MRYVVSSLFVLLSRLRQGDVSAWGTLLFGAAFALSLTPWVSPAAGLGAGIVLALGSEKLGLGNPLISRGGAVSGRLLRLGVILLGFGMHLPQVLEVGRDGAVLAAVTIAGTMALGYGLGRGLRVDGRTSTLISAGTAVCGGSAIAAMAAVIGAAEGEIAVALGTVFLLNAAALYLFPWLGQVLGMAPEQFGLWAGVAIHDLSSVVGAASVYDPDALQIATAVKLSRTLWIVPMALVAASWLKRRQGGSGGVRVKPPYFIVLFLVASVCRTYVPGVAAWAPALTTVAKGLLSGALFVIGAGISPSALRRVGWKPMVQGLVLWVFISAAALAGTVAG